MNSNVYIPVFWLLGPLGPSMRRRVQATKVKMEASIRSTGQAACQPKGWEGPK